MFGSGSGNISSGGSGLSTPTALIAGVAASVVVAATAASAASVVATTTIPSNGSDDDAQKPTVDGGHADTDASRNTAVSAAAALGALLDDDDQTPNADVLLEFLARNKCLEGEFGVGARVGRLCKKCLIVMGSSATRTCDAHKSRLPKVLLNTFYGVIISFSVRFAPYTHVKRTCRRSGVHMCLRLCVFV